MTPAVRAAVRATVRAAAAGLLLVGVLPTAWACGACVEDKVAAAYDHAVVRDAAAHSRAVVFCELGGPQDAVRLRAAARRVKGLDPSSLRLSGNPAALSFALDVAQQRPEAAVEALERAAPRGTHLHVIRILDAAPRATTASSAQAADPAAKHAGTR